MKIKNKESIKTGIIAGFFGSLCCTVPIIIVALGLSSIGFALGFAKYRPFFLILGIVFLLVSLYKTIKKKEGVCNTDSIKKNIDIIIISTIVAIVIWSLLLYVIAPALGRIVYG